MKRLITALIMSVFILSGFYVIANTMPFQDNINSNESKKSYQSSGNLNPIWNKTWGGVGIDMGQSLAVDNSGLYVAGYTDSFGSGQKDISLLKYDLDGNPQKTATWGGSGNDTAESITISNSFLYVSGYTGSFGNGGWDMAVLKFDLDLNFIWSRTWGGAYDDDATSIVADDSYIYASGWSFNAGGGNPVILKYDPNGNMIWNRTWGGSPYAGGLGMALDDSNIYICGSETGPGVYDAFVLKYDKDGNHIWNRTWGGNKADVAISVSVFGSGIFVTGYSESNSVNILSDIMLLNYNMNGDLLWNKTWGTSRGESGSSIIVYNSNIYIVGMTSDFTAHSGDIICLKCNLNGDVIWNKTWGGNKNDCAFDFKIYKQNIYIAGYTGNYDMGDTDILILKTDLDGGNGTVYEFNISYSIPLLIAVIAIFVIYRKNRHF